jgi:hypothetical protein
VTPTAIVLAISTSLIASVIYATIGGGYRRWFGQEIKITDPQPESVLAAAEDIGGVIAHPVYGTLKYLSRGHKIWLLVVDESGGNIWPPGFTPVDYRKEQGTWKGYIHVWGWHQITIVAVVAPPTTQDYFNYYQKLGRDFNSKFPPISRIPPECRKHVSVHARVPPVPVKTGS